MAACRNARSAAGGCCRARSRRCLSRFDLCLAQSAADARTLRAARRAARQHGPAISSSTCRAPPVDEADACTIEGDHRLAPGHRRGLDPCRRRDRDHRRASAAARQISVAVDGDRAAPSRARREHRRNRQSRPAVGRACARAATLPKPDIDIYIADTLGELGLIYRLAPIVFMGGSLASHGGQNPIEAIRLGAAVVHGPHVWNFAEIYATLDAAHGAGLRRRRRRA